MIKTVLSLLSPSGKNGHLNTFIFHRVLPVQDSIFPDEPDAARFDEMMGWLKSWFNVMPLDTAVKALKMGTLPQRAAAITFDDGYADNYTVALPILEKHGLNATFFITTGFLDGGRMWNDTVVETIRAARNKEIDLSFLQLGTHIIDSPTKKRAAIELIIGKIKYLPLPERLSVTEKLANIACVAPPNNLMMNSEQVIKLHQTGMGIGAHTISHPILAKLSEADAVKEISGSRDFLSDLTKKPVTLFAYPNGKPGIDYFQEQTKLVKSLGFDAAVSTTHGAANSNTDLFQIPRFTPWDKTKFRFAARMAKNYTK